MSYSESDPGGGEGAGQNFSILIFRLLKLSLHFRIIDSSKVVYVCGLKKVSSKALNKHGVNVIHNLILSYKWIFSHPTTRLTIWETRQKPGAGPKHRCKLLFQ